MGGCRPARSITPNSPVVANQPTMTKVMTKVMMRVVMMLIVAVKETAEEETTVVLTVARRVTTPQLLPRQPLVWSGRWWGSARACPRGRWSR